MGHSLSVLAVAFVSQFFMTIFVYLGSVFYEPLAGLKVYNLLVLSLAGWGMHRWICDQTGNHTSGAVAALFYVMGPLITLRTCILEHSGMAMSFVFVPWIYRGIAVLTRQTSPKEVVLLGFCAAGLALSYTKVALLMMPLLLVWAVANLPWSHKAQIPKIVFLWMGSLAISLVLTLPFLLPSVRDFKIMATFLLDPLEGWQEAYAYRSALALVDLWKVFLPGSSEAVARNAQNFYFGLIPMALLVWGLTSDRFAAFRKSSLGRSAVLLVLVGLMGLWFASGAKSILAGLNSFLAGAQGMKDWALPLVLGMFLLQAFMVWKCGQELVGQKTAWILLLIFLLVPGFRLIEQLPFFGDIRAPEAFWSVGGYSAWVAGLAIFAGHGLGQISMIRQILVLGVFLLVDVTPIFSAYFNRGLPGKLFQAYEAVCAKIKQSGQAGRILPLSGRYFYLTLPQKTAMPLSTEAAGRHFQMKWVRYMENAGNTTPENLRNYLNVAGVTYVFIDRQDPDTPQNLQQYFQQLFPQTFQDDYFTVLLNPGSLYPAFLANQGAAVPRDSYEAAPSFLELSRLNFVAVESGDLNPGDLPAVAATMGKNAGEFELAPEFRDRKGDSFQRLAADAPRFSNYGAMSFSVPARSVKSWLVICEAFHPDWKAFWNDQAVPVCRAIGGLLAVPCPSEGGKVRLEYQPPIWYPVSYGFGIFMWISAIVFLGLGRLGSKGWKKWWEGEELEIETSAEKVAARKKEAKGQSNAGKIQKFLVILPTYNEGETIQHVLEEVQTKAPGAEILVVDDNSPDGTAAKVKQTPNFGKKVHLLERPGKAGLGSAYKEGFQWALKRGYDAVVEMDADLSHDPADVPKLLQALADGADMAVGSRYLNGVRVLNWPQSRLWVSSFGGWYARMLTGLPMTDPTSGFKAIRRRVLEGLDWDKFTAQGYGFQIEIHFLAWQGGFRIQEVPIVFTERREGQSKMSPQIAQEAALRVLQLALRRIFP
jgi:dolichol-phosphate mannosyltransferase